MVSEDAQWLLKHGIPVDVVVQSKSMEPSIRMGTKVRIEPLHIRPRVGDIVLIQSSNGLLLHRIVGFTRDAHNEYVFHAGETASYATMCSATQILGRAVNKPYSQTIPCLEMLSPQSQERIYKLERQCRRYAFLRSMAYSLRLNRVRLFRKAIQFFRNRSF